MRASWRLKSYSSGATTGLHREGRTLTKITRLTVLDLSHTRLRDVLRRQIWMNFRPNSKQQKICNKMFWIGNLPPFKFGKKGVPKKDDVYDDVDDNFDDDDD